MLILLFLFSFIFDYIFLIAIIIIIGFCGGLALTIISAIIIETNIGKEGFYTNISHIFYSIGAFLGPYISIIVLKYNKCKYIKFN